MFTLLKNSMQFNWTFFLNELLKVLLKATDLNYILNVQCVLFMNNMMESYNIFLSQETNEQINTDKINLCIIESITTK